MNILNYRWLMNLKYRFLILSLLSLTPALVYAQGEKKYVRQGNREFEKSKFSESEISYRRALDKAKIYPDAVFNTGDALYRQKKYEDAGKQFAENSTMNEDRAKKSAALYNLGNSLLQANKVQESIEAYKSSLKVKPDNPEAKYNLAYAQDLLKQQQQQQQDQNKKDQNKDQKKDQENKNDQNKDDQKQNNDQEKQQQNQQQTISKEDAERLLNAIANDEKNVQEKVKLAKAAKAKVRTLKNW